MKKNRQTFSSKMIKLVQEKGLDYLFAGEGGQVLSSSTMLQIILQMKGHDLIWKKLNGSLLKQQEAMIEVKEHLTLNGFPVAFESEGGFLYLIINT